MSTSQPLIVCYISGHGFGHAVRTMEVLRALRRLRPDATIHLRTTVPRWLFDSVWDERFSYAPAQLDVGVIQRDSLTLDIEATLRAYAGIVENTRTLVDNELSALRALRPAVIFADIPPLAFDIAAGLQVPGVAMTNFSWDWIYADYVVDFPRYAALVDAVRASYRHATMLLRLPFHGDLSAFPIIRDVPLVARHATHQRHAVRQRLHLPMEGRLVLLSFGGIGLTLQSGMSNADGITYIATQSAAALGRPSGCRLISNAEMQRAGLAYEDVVAASDAVITKPGYGIVSDCIANGTPMIYTSRGRFAEYDCLVAGIQAHLPHAFISNDDLYAGHWQGALQQVLAQPRHTATRDTNGAEVVARMLVSLL